MFHRLDLTDLMKLMFNEVFLDPPLSSQYKKPSEKDVMAEQLSMLQLSKGLKTTVSGKSQYPQEDMSG